MSTRVRLVGYGLFMLALAVLYFALPQFHTVLYAVPGVTGVAAVVTGLVINRPRHRWPWVLLAAAVLASTLGDAIFNTLTDLRGVAPYPSVADVLYLAMYPLAAASFLGFVRLRNVGRDRGRLLDALILTVGLTVLSWIFLMVPYLRDGALSVAEKSVSMAYPLGDLLILATLLRLLSGVRRTFSFDLLTVGAVAVLFGDVVYGLLQLGGSWQDGTPLDVCWFVQYGCWGAAALHPSMRRLTEPAPSAPAEVPAARQLVLLALTTLIAPAALLIQAANGSIEDAPIIAAMSGLMFVMILMRLGAVVSGHRQALERERGLREASATLVAASSVDEVLTALRLAVEPLVPPGTDHRVLLVALPDTQVQERSSDSATRLVRSSEIDGGADVALVYPLTLVDPTRSLGKRALVVAADEATLLRLESSLEVMASQGILALERIALTAEINKRNSEAYFRTLVQNATDIILIIDENDCVRYASPSAEAVYGIESPVGTLIYDAIHPEEQANLREAVVRIRGGGRDDRSDWRIQRRDGSWIQAEVAFRDLRDDQTVGGLVLTLRDVTDRRQLEEDLTHQAFHDSLTGLANRVLFTDRAGHALARADRRGGLIGVMIVDLDDFKVVNDTLGHRAGDELLVAVAQRLSGIVRAHDTAARLGGDEFAVLMEDATHSSEIEEVAQRIIDALADPFVLGGETVNAAASVGVATTTEADTAEELLRQADLALYLAKGAGKGQWRRYQATLHTAIVERLELRTDLDRAVSEGSFTLHYQPIVHLATGELAGFEALVRWPHPTRGLIQPGQFIDIAEECGLIVPIGNWVLDHALETAAQWLDAGQRQMQYISVNVSARQFRAPRFAERVGAALDRAGVPRSSLMLEITESLLLRDDEQVWSDLTALRDTGVQIAIDDFGTGYSSLSYLRKFPIDVVKIDKSFIDDLATSDQQRAVVDAIVRLAQTLNLRVIAEGIEEPTQRDLLLRMGCPLGQGYLFSRPVPAAAAGEWLIPREAALA